MFRTLYGRLLVLFLAVLLGAMSLLSVLLYQRIRTDKMDSRLYELTIQARDVAFLAGQRTGNLDIQTNRYLLWKVTEIMNEFDAYIIILDRARNIIPIGDSTVEYSMDFTLEETYALLSSALTTGQERLVRTEMDNGNAVFTVVVPYVYEGEVLGAVFAHTSEQTVEASYSDILAETIRSMMIVLAIGSFMILIISRFITRPLSQMAKAVDRFARGDFEQRVPVDSRDEVGQLAESFNRMAEELGRLEQSRRSFVANVSHELRSPLTSIQGFINGMLDGTVPEDEREQYLTIVLDETRRMNKLITTLLDLSRIDNGDEQLNMQRFDINEMIARVLLRQETRIDERHIDVQIDFEEETCYVKADADRIEQVVVNLIDNAIKYGKDNGKISLSTSRKSNIVHVSIGDDGQGISKEDLPFVFERFYTADKAHTKGNGTGLGLSIVNSILQEHGQTISVTSELGEGSVFTFTLQAG